MKLQSIPYFVVFISHVCMFFFIDKVFIALQQLLSLFTNTIYIL